LTQINRLPDARHNLTPSQRPHPSGKVSSTCAAAWWKHSTCRLCWPWRKASLPMEDCKPWPCHA